MADVGPPGTGRGQLLVVTSLVMAVLFVGLALVLNGGIYAENLSTRDTGDETRPAFIHLHLTSDDLGALIDRANAAVEADDINTVEETFYDGFDHWATAQTGEQALIGRSFGADVVETNEGTHVLQTDYDRNLTAGGDVHGQADWELAAGATEAGEFEMVLYRPSLLNATGETLGALAGESFHVTIETDEDQWRVFVFRGAITGNAYLIVEQPDENFSGNTTEIDFTSACSYDGENVSIDIRNGEWGDDADDCEQLSFYEDEVLRSEHTISYNNTRTDGDLLGITADDRAKGNYSVIVDARADRTPYYEPTSTENPTANAIIYDATADYHYESGRVIVEGDDVKAWWEAVR